MKTPKRDAVAFAACLGVCVVLGGWNAGPAPVPERAVPLDKPSAAVLRLDKPAREGEDPNEDALITAALEAQGYFRPEVPLSYELQDALHTACERHGVDYTTVLGLIQVESGFDEAAVNPATECYGLCQLSPRYFPGDLTPAENIEAGVAYLGEQLERYGGDIGAALRAYNRGYDDGDRAYANAVLSAAEGWEI